jgi:hypothetical protein
MSLATVAIPDSLYERVKQMAEEQHVSVDQFVASAVAEKMAVVEKEGYLALRASRADEKRFREALSHIPDTAPPEHDKL